MLAVRNKDTMIFPKETMIGALAEYISTPNEKFQPMNANFGILRPKIELNIHDKKKKNETTANSAIEVLCKLLKK